MLYPITNIQRFSTQDGPGIRTTVFFKGCPLRCRWCHNPETQLTIPQIFYIPQNCIGCGACINVCPHKAQYLDEERHHCFDINKCTGCLACVSVCPSNGVEATSRYMSVQEIMDVVLKDKAFYGENGGITLSGGEPLLHAEACLELLHLAKENGITTAIETSGYFEKKYIQPLTQVTDLFLWDFKDSNAQRHQEFVGVSGEKIISNLLYADQFQTKIILRCIMVKGVNMNHDHYQAIAALYSRLQHCAGVELLPYHAWGGSKNKQLGFDDNGRKEWIPQADDMYHVIETLRSLGVVVVNTD